MAPQRYIKVEGSARERGRMMGEQLQDQITTILKIQEEAEKRQDGLSLHDWMPHAQALFPFIREHAPETLAELEGMAAGSGLPLDDLLLLTCTYEKWMDFHHASHCTAFAAVGAATVDGHLVCGQTNDEELHCWADGQADAVIHHTDEAGLQTLIYTHPGIPAYMGMNSVGLCVLWMYIDNGERAAGVPTNILIREMLRRTTLASALEYLNNTPRAVPNAFLVARESEGICTLECSPTAFHPTHSSTSLCHANHILAAEMSAADVYFGRPGQTSSSRCESMAALLARHHGSMDADAAKGLLCDHERAPACICVHPHSGAVNMKTLAAMVFHPAAGQMHIAFGNGCEMPFHTFGFDC